MEKDEHKHIFICGLNRCGTTVLQKLISSAENTSGFSNTGVLEDEGQHLQSVYPQAWHYGGAGNFAFSDKAHLTEKSTLVTEHNKIKLWNEWSVHWDLKNKYLVEKSPPNVISTRFLQAIFPNSFFLCIIRNPIAVSLATKKWSKNSIGTLIDHWIYAYNILKEDRARLNNHVLISYEELMTNPELIFKYIKTTIGPEINDYSIFENKNVGYLNKWDNIGKYNPFKSALKSRIIRKKEEIVSQLGYSLIDHNVFPTLNNSDDL